MPRHSNEGKAKDQTLDESPIVKSLVEVQSPEMEQNVHADGSCATLKSILAIAVVIQKRLKCTTIPLHALSPEHRT